MTMATVLLVVGVGMSLGSNPLVPGVGMADPNLHRFNGSYYVFATHDFSVNNTGFLMKDWWCWSSPDLVSWSLSSVIQPNVTLPWSTEGERNECWATDAAFTNNKFYFYLSVGPSEVAVVVADAVTGPWHDPLGYPLLNDTLGSSLVPKTTFRDPCVFEDDDGTFYIIAGVFNYYVTRLNPDMISLAEKPRHVVVNNPYGPCGDNVTDDKPFIHKEGEWYYLSWGCFYAMSKSVYGPYDMVGSVVSTSLIAPAFRMNQSGDAGRPYRVGAPPASGDGLELYDCANASAAAWIPIPSFSAPKFALALKENPSLCVIGSGGPLRLGPCVNGSTAQMFSVSQTSSGADIHGVDRACPCWNVQDNNARSRQGRGPGNGATLQCFTCVDGGNFNPNQRFQFDVSTGQIQAWDGYAKGACVAVNYPGNTLPPRPPPLPPGPPAPWYRAEDYTDRHGSFLKSGGQWYYASNDRSHSGDPRPAFFRDTVVCYIHFRANGTMEPCIINAQGVNEYTAASIQAEEFSELIGQGHKVDLLAHGGGDGFAVSLSQSARLRFAAVRGLPSTPTLRLRVARGLPGTARVVVSTGGETPEVLGRCFVEGTESWSNYVMVFCPLAEQLLELETTEVVVMVEAESASNSDEVLRLDWFSID